MAAPTGKFTIDDLAFGWQLNQLQGAVPDVTDLHLADLLCSGKITLDEYIALIRELALAEVSTASLAAAE